MSERFAAEIRIGGEIRAALVPEVCQAITSESVSLEWGDAPFEPQSAEELLRNRILVEGMHVLKLCDDQARWGSLPDLELFLKQHAIPFDRLTEGGCGYDAEREGFRPGNEPVTVRTSVEGNPLVPQEILTTVIQNLQELLTAASRRDLTHVKMLARTALQVLRAAVPTVPALPSLTVVP